jgi:cell pole-organizing protein PopZ
MTRKTLDPNLASILDSIRATVGGDAPVQAADPTGAVPDEQAEPEDASPEQAAAPKGGRAKKLAAAPAAQASHALPPSGSRTVEDFLAELIRPQVDAWLKANLPELIQKMAAEEIARLTGRK